MATRTAGLTVRSCAEKSLESGPPATDCYQQLGVPGLQRFRTHAADTQPVQLIGKYRQQTFSIASRGRHRDCEGTVA